MAVIMGRAMIMATMMEHESWDWNNPAMIHVIKNI